jgi:hypothetical protein
MLTRFRRVGASLVEASTFIGSIRRESRHHLLTFYEASSILFNPHLFSGRLKKTLEELSRASNRRSYASKRLGLLVHRIFSVLEIRRHLSVEPVEQSSVDVEH